MNPAELDALIHSQKKDGEHGARNCPKCERGFMAYVVTGSSGMYACQKCSWIEFGHPPWPAGR